MRVLVFPHDLNMGGSQMNAIELAAAVRDLGHECVVFGHRGLLCEKIEALGLEFIEAPRPSHRPTPRIVGALGNLIDERSIDIVHGYEWPPGLEGFLATQRRSRARAVCTIMSMAVAPFIPRQMPLIVGTRQIAAHEISTGRRDVDVLEPPVDLRHNRAPDPQTLDAFKRRWQLDGRPLVVCVSRLAHELKSEGILTAIEVAGMLSGTNPFQLLIVGDGPARDEITAAALRVNQQTSANTVVITGELVDPRPAYALADISIGMGGSALRALAFGAPLIVQGEKGFFQTLTPESLGVFQWQGWYGVGEGAYRGSNALVSQLTPLLQNPSQRFNLGKYSRDVAELFSLDAAARRQVAIYERTLEAQQPARLTAITDGVSSAWTFAGHFARSQFDRVLRRSRRDDFNAQPVAAGPAEAQQQATRRAATGPIVYFPGVSWGSVAGTDRNLVASIASHREVLWIETRSIYRALREGRLDPRTSEPLPNVTMLVIHVPPGVSRPVLRGLANRIVARQVDRYLNEHIIAPVATIASTTEPLLHLSRDKSGVRIYFATDDFVAGAELLHRPARYLSRCRELNLRSADLVLAVTPELARELQRTAVAPKWLPNGADLSRYADIEDVPPSPEVDLPQPIAGVVGQFNERTDFRYLQAVQQAGISMLLVGPRFFGADVDAEFEKLICQPNVQWVDRVPVDRLPPLMRTISVGLTPYTDTDFNRRSYPLKTLEYLSAGIPVVSTSVPPLVGFDRRFVAAADTPEGFVATLERLMAERHSRAVIRASVATSSWDDRARQVLDEIDSIYQREARQHPPSEDHRVQPEENHATQDPRR